MEPADEYFYYCYEGFLEENWMKCSQRELAKKRQRSIARSRVLADGDKRSKIGSTLTEQQDTGFSGFEDVFEEEPQDRLFSRIASVDFDQQKAAYRPLLPSTHCLLTAHSLPCSIVPGLEQNIHDKSRATHADAAIHPLLYAVNHHESDDYYTTSSCAGRTIITQSCPTSGYNVDWLYITHDLATVPDALAAIEKRKKTDCKEYRTPILRLSGLTAF